MQEVTKVVPLCKMAEKLEDFRYTFKFVKIYGKYDRKKSKEKHFSLEKTLLACWESQYRNRLKE